MSKNHPWYKRYPVDFIHGTMGLSLEEKGAYSLLLDLIYDKGGAIVDDARYLAGICNISLRKWASLRQRLIDAQKICIEDGFIFNIRAQKEIEALLKLEQKLSESGAKGGRKRAQNERTPKDINTLDEAPLNHICALDKDKEIDKDKDVYLKEQPQKGCRLPQDFTPDFAIALSEGFSPFQAQKLFENFKDYWNAKAGKDATKLDWQATWRNWVRSSYNQKFKGKSHDNTAIGYAPYDEAKTNRNGKSYGERVTDEMRNLINRADFKTPTKHYNAELPRIFSNGQETIKRADCTNNKTHH